MVINNYNANRGDFGKDRMRLYLKKKKRAETIGFKSWKGNKVFDRVYWKLFFPSPITPKPYQRRNNTHIWRVPETKSILLLELTQIKKQRKYSGGRYSLFFLLNYSRTQYQTEENVWKIRNRFLCFNAILPVSLRLERPYSLILWRNNTHNKSVILNKKCIFAVFD